MLTCYGNMLTRDVRRARNSPNSVCDDVLHLLAANISAEGIAVVDSASRGRAREAIGGCVHSTRLLLPYYSAYFAQALRPRHS